MEEKQRNEEAEKQIEELRQMKCDYLEIFSTDAGKRVLRSLEDTCFVDRTTFPRDAQGITLAFHEGMRFVAVHIKNMMNMEINNLHKLVRGE